MIDDELKIRKQEDPKNYCRTAKRERIAPQTSVGTFKNHRKMDHYQTHVPVKKIKNSKSKPDLDSRPYESRFPRKTLETKVLSSRDYQKTT